MYKLVISDDEGKTTVVPLVRDEISIGRAEGNTIRLTDRNVSREHAKLVKVSGGYTVQDQDSYNGVAINGTKIEGEGQIKPGDEIRIGDYMLALHVDSTEVTEGSVSRPLPKDSTPPARLVMLTAPVPGAEFALAGDHARIGRSEDLEVWINHRSISREHAEIVRDDDGELRIVDLGSANGVQVNGEEVEETVLEPYDVVKLGRVRLRYIPEGEGYVFDPEAEQSPEDDEAEEGSSSSRAPLFMALGIVAIAAVIGWVIITYAGTPAAEADKEGELVAAEDGTTVDGPPGAEAGEDDEPPSFDESLTGCESELKEGHFAAAAEHAEAALAVRPDHDGAAECRGKAMAGVSFTEGHEAFEAGDVETAYLAYAQIPEGNPFLQHPSIAEVRQAYAEHQMEQARKLAVKEPERAMEHVQTLLGMEKAPRALKRSALKLRRKLRAKLGSSPRESASEGDDGEAGSGPSPFEKALECARQGDNACVVQTLEGNTRTAQGLALLIETYRTMGDTQAAAHNMRSFVERYPSDRRASGYQQFLDNQ